MVARIKYPKRINAALNYNEKKVVKGVAELIHGQGYISDVSRLNHYEKLEAFNERINLSKCTIKSLHISLNFHADDTLDKEKLTQIANDYMEKIGFGEQPYLVYQHHDAGHPHIHIVTTNIKRNGLSLPLHNIGRIQSEQARKEIETAYNLVRAEGRKQKPAYELKSAYQKAVTYGKGETRNAIRNVLLHVVNVYNYTSLPELNAILRQFNVEAERGTETSRTFQNNGLVYRILNEDGMPVGMPIKASLFAENPGLKLLEERFKKNAANRQYHKRTIKNKIDRYFLSNSRPTMQAFVDAMARQGMDVVLRTNKDGIVYGLTYVDHQAKCAINGSQLGVGYAAKAIQEKCVAPRLESFSESKSVSAHSEAFHNDDLLNKDETLLDIALRDEQVIDMVDPAFLNDKRKKKRSRKI